MLQCYELFATFRSAAIVLTVEFGIKDVSDRRRDHFAYAIRGPLSLDLFLWSALRRVIANRQTTVSIRTICELHPTIKRRWHTEVRRLRNPVAHLIHCGGGQFSQR